MKNQDILDQLPHLSVSQLEELVLYHNALYFDKNAPEISDEAFDKLVEALKHRKPDSRVLDLIGGERPPAASGHDTIEHIRPMLSLEKCYDDETFKKWREKIRSKLIAMPKIDGVACSIHYDKNGSLVLGATRGDGRVGENITKNVKAIQDVITTMPKDLAQSILADGQDTIEVRGEVYMKLSRFQKHYAETFANPRNLAAGALKQKEIERSRAYGLSFFPYDIKGTTFATETEKFEFLKTIGFELPPLEIISENEIGADAYRHFVKMRDQLDYEIDGVVYRADDVSLQYRLGETAHHPRWSIAYKFQGESAQTELVQVEWSVGRTGAITPVAVVLPVFVSGATVTRASLHNWGMVQKLGLKTHSLVEIVRRGGVIPHVERVLDARGHHIQPPTECPSCKKTPTTEGDFIRCSDPTHCKDVQVAKIIYFCRVVGIDGFGDKLVETLVERKIVQNLADLYRLSVEDLMPLERMGTTLATKLVKQVNDHKKIPLATFLAALGFEEVGPTVAETIVSYVGSIERLLQVDREELSQIHGIGPSIGNAVLDGISAQKLEIEDLLSLIEIEPVKKISFDQGHALFGKSVVFTGTLTHFDRKSAQKLVRQAGGQTPSSVSSNTDYLVIGEDEKKSSKQKEAERLKAQGADIQIIHEKEFLRLMGIS